MDSILKWRNQKNGTPWYFNNKNDIIRFDRFKNTYYGHPNMDTPPAIVMPYRKFIPEKPVEEKLIEKNLFKKNLNGNKTKLLS